MFSGNSVLCSYYHFLIYKIKLAEDKAKVFCDCLSVMDSGGHLGALSDIFSTGKKVFDANKGLKLSLFSSEPSKSEIEEMLRFPTYSKYLEYRVPLYVNYVIIVAKLIQSGGYQGTVSTSFHAVELLNKNSSKEEINAAMLKGIENMKRGLRSDIKIIDEDKTTYVMSEITNIPTTQLDEAIAKNIVVHDVGVKDIKASIMMGVQVPITVKEIKDAREVLTNEDEKIPLFITKFEKVDGKLSMGKRTPIQVEGGSIEKMGFDYYKLASSKDKVKTNTTNLGYDIIDWDTTKNFQRLVSEVEKDKLKPGDPVYFCTSWLSVKHSAKFRVFLSKCRFKYVGKGTGLWNWVGRLEEREIMPADQMYVMLRLIPKFYKLCILLGARVRKWEKDSSAFISTALGFYGLGKKTKEITYAIGHLLEVELIYKVNMNYKPKKGVSPEVLEQWFDDGMSEYSAQDVKVEFDGLAGLYDDRDIENGEKGNVKKKKIIPVEEKIVKIGGKSIDSQVKQKVDVKNDTVIKNRIYKYDNSDGYDSMSVFAEKCGFETSDKIVSIINSAVDVSGRIVYDPGLMILLRQCNWDVVSCGFFLEELSLGKYVWNGEEFDGVNTIVINGRFIVITYDDPKREVLSVPHNVVSWKGILVVYDGELYFGIPERGSNKIVQSPIMDIKINNDSRNNNNIDKNQERFKNVENKKPTLSLRPDGKINVSGISKKKLLGKKTTGRLVKKNESNDLGNNNTAIIDIADDMFS
jgi:hypothetical protein